MREDRVRYFAENMERLSRRDRVFLNNPVIMQGLGLAPLVIAASSVRNAVVLSLAVLLLLTPTRVLATILGQRVNLYWRAVVYALTAGVLYIGVAFALEALLGPARVLSVGIYLPLLVMEPLIVKRYENPQRERVSTSVKKGLITTLGYCLVLFVLAAIREVLGQGTLAGFLLFDFKLLPLAGMPAGGFITLGLLTALWRVLVAVFRDRVRRGMEEL